MLSLVLFAVLGLASRCSASSGTTVVYHGEHAPNFWDRISPNCCGANQSPINFEPLTVLPIVLEKLELLGYDKKFESGNLTLDHNANTIQVDIPSSAEISLGIRGLFGIGGGSYKLAQFHFHWGMNDYRGSEHTVDGEAFPAEIHFVHYNTKYGNLSDALTHKDGLAVLGVFVDVDYESLVPNAGFEALHAPIMAAKEPGTHAAIDSVLKLSDFLPENVQAYTRYSGSLTTPTCDEVVTWTVLRDPIYVSGAQIQYLREYMLWVGPTGALSAHFDNFRPVQPRNCRSVHRSFWGEYTAPKSAEQCSKKNCLL